MRLLFFDSMIVDFDTQSPAAKPLGGTQSAIAYLARELAQLGEDIAVLNGVTAPCRTEGVDFVPFPCDASFLNSFDCIVVVANSNGKVLREIGVTRPIVMWCQHAPDQPAVAPLQDPMERDAVDFYVMVSAWQAAGYQARFGISPAKMRVIGNAIAPSFGTATLQPCWLERGTAPVLAYASTPFRGLDVLLLAFPMIRAALPGAELRVFSGMGVYGTPDEDDQYRSLFHLCQALEGVDYQGPQPQARLAEALSEVDFLAYPSTFAETFCIVVAEAMAAGARPITTTLGALPEITGGFAVMLSEPAADKAIFATRYAEAVIAAARPSDCDAAIAHRAAQIRFARDTHNWRARALDWQALLRR